LEIRNNKSSEIFEEILKDLGEGIKSSPQRKNALQWKISFSKLFLNFL